MPRQLHIGTWLPQWKRERLDVENFADLCERKGCKLTEIDLQVPLSRQGPFDIILHKITDVLTIASKNGDKSATQQLANFRDYVHRHPEVVVVDPLENVQPLLDRGKMCMTLSNSDLMRNGIQKNVFVPDFVVLNSTDVETNAASLRKAMVTYPCVCKPLHTGDPDTSHSMAIVFCKDGLNDVKTPCVAQSFINHDGVIHKIFVAGDKMYFFQRPSVKNLMPGQFRTINFITKEVSKPYSESHLHQREKDPNSICYNPDFELLRRIADTLGKSLGLTLFGVDIIMDKDTGRYAIIEVNPFPGYEGVPDFHEVLLDFLAKRVEEKRTPNGHPMDR